MTQKLGRRGLLATTLTPALAGAQPIAPSRIVVGFPAGSIPDTVARRYAEALSPAGGPAVLVDNRVGASGRVAIGAMRQMPADGSTIQLLPAAAATIYPFLFRQPGFDADRDLPPCSPAATAFLGLAVGPAVPEGVRNVADFLAWARANPARASYGSPSLGTLPHLMQARLFEAAGVEATHVPYTGGPAALVDLMAGRIASLILPEGLLREGQAAGRLRVIVSFGATRSPFLPEVPSIAEQGFPALAVQEWFAFFLPPGTPPGVAERVAGAIGVAGAEPGLRGGFATLGLLPLTGSPAETTARIEAERAVWRDFLPRSGIRADG